MEYFLWHVKFSDVVMFCFFVGGNIYQTEYTYITEYNKQS